MAKEYAVFQAMFEQCPYWDERVTHMWLYGKCTNCGCDMPKDVLERIKKDIREKAS